MKLKTTERESGKKGVLTKIRAAGDIPAVVYSSNSQSTTITVSGADFDAALRSIEKGHLPTTIFEIEVAGKTHKAIVKDIQYHSTTYKVKHLDLFLLEDGQDVLVNVPVRCAGVADCVGIKLGGFLRQVKRHIKVKCKPEDIPSHFDVDIRELGINQSRKAKHINMSEKTKCLFPLEEVVVTIAKR